MVKPITRWEWEGKKAIELIFPIKLITEGAAV